MSPCGRPRRDGGTASDDWRRLIALQRRTGLSTADLAHLLGISSAQLRLYRSASIRRRPPERVLQRLADVERLVQGEGHLLIAGNKGFLATPLSLERVIVTGNIRVCPVCGTKMVGRKQTCTGYRGACGKKLREVEGGPAR